MNILIVGSGGSRTLPPEVAEALEEYLADDEKSPKTNRPPPTVLVVDDDSDIRSTLGELLQDEGYGVATARDGLDALNQLYDGPRPDLILLDLMMPRMSGFAFLGAYEKTAYADIPVIFISAGERRPRHDERYVFMGKPIDVEALVELIDRKVKEGRSRRG